MLQVKASEVVEHLREEEYQKKDGHKVIFAILDKRWLENDRTDEIAEKLTEIFMLKAREGEQLRSWSARSRSAFERCSRKTGAMDPRPMASRTRSRRCSRHDVAREVPGVWESKVSEVPPGLRRSSVLQKAHTVQALRPYRPLSA